MKVLYISLDDIVFGEHQNDPTITQITCTDETGNKIVVEYSPRERKINVTTNGVSISYSDKVILVPLGEDDEKRKKLEAVFGH